VSVTLHPSDRGDTTSIEQTFQQVDQNMVAVMKDEKACEELRESAVGGLREAVADKGYHSNAVLKDQCEREIRTYISEPSRGRRDWEGKLEEREAVYRPAVARRAWRSAIALRLRRRGRERPPPTTRPTPDACRLRLFWA
jgi:transposase